MRVVVAAAVLGVAAWAVANPAGIVGAVVGALVAVQVAVVIALVRVRVLQAALGPPADTRTGATGSNDGTGGPSGTGATSP